MKLDGKEEKEEKKRAGSQDELSCPVQRWQPERRRDEKRRFFLLYSNLSLPPSFTLLLCDPLCLSLWV